MTYMMVATRTTRSNFDRAMRRGFWERLKQRLQHQSTHLIDFADVKGEFKSYNEFYRGISPIPIQHIVGSIGHNDAFDRNFMPISEHIERKWQHILNLMVHSFDLPPIDVYQIGDVFFVIDGNHRVSVSRFLGIQYIDAHVIELKRN